MSVAAAVDKRMSCRRFLKDRPVPLGVNPFSPPQSSHCIRCPCPFTRRIAVAAVVRDIVEAATRAPSGGNTQPWHVYVVAGPVRDALCRAASEAAASGTIK
eukprot:gene7818-7254_t